MGFLSLRRAQATLVAVLSLLTAVASSVEEDRLQRAQAPAAVASVMLQALEHRLNSCGTQA